MMMRERAAAIPAARRMAVEYATECSLISSPSSVFAGDLDGDGLVDLACASFPDNTVAWFKNLGGDPTSGLFGYQAAAPAANLRIISTIALMAMMAPDIVQLDDGGPGRRAARHPILGKQRVARLIMNLSKRLVASHSMDVVEVNGSLGILFRSHGIPDMVMTFDYNTDGLVRRIFLQLNPDKLRHVT